MSVISYRGQESYENADISNTIESKFKSICIFCHIILLRMFNIIHLLKSPSLDVAVKKVESWRTVMALEVNL